VSYYNPAPLPNPGGDVSTGVAALSYCNGPDSMYPQYCPAQDAPSAPLLAVDTAKTGSAGDSGTTTSLTTSISIANGPTATSVRPVRLSRTAGTAYTLTIQGASLTGATLVTLVGGGNDVVVFGPLVSDDGRVLTVDLFVSPGAPLGLANVIVSGAGWSTAEDPNMRVEIVP